MPERTILHLASHSPTREMRRRGVYELTTVQRKRFEELIDLPSEPSTRDLQQRAEKIARMADQAGVRRAVVHVPIMLVGALERELRQRDITPIYACGEVHRYEVNGTDGEPELQCAFRFQGFVKSPNNG